MFIHTTLSRNPKQNILDTKNIFKCEMPKLTVSVRLLIFKIFSFIFNFEDLFEFNLC